MEIITPKKRVIILGSTGMLGHVLHFVLENEFDFELFDISYRKKLTNNSIICDVNNINDLDKKIEKIKPDVIVNCIGILMKGSKIDSANTIYINSYLPHRLKQIADKIGGRVIQISTDCVFSGKKGYYSENHIPDSTDIYGRSKTLGELINDRDLTIRTSIVGPEIKNDGEGLLDWFLKQEGKINGYSNVFWGGVTTITLSKAIVKFIYNPQIVGLLHLTNGKKISKYDLLSLFFQFFPKNNLEINKTQAKPSDKSLISEKGHSLFLVPSYIEMIKEMRDHMIQNKNIYNFK